MLPDISAALAGGGALVLLLAPGQAGLAAEATGGAAGTASGTYFSGGKGGNAGENGEAGQGPRGGAGGTAGSPNGVGGGVYSGAVSGGGGGAGGLSGTADTASGDLTTSWTGGKGGNGGSPGGGGGAGGDGVRISGAGAINVTATVTGGAGGNGGNRSGAQTSANRILAGGSGGGGAGIVLLDDSTVTVSGKVTGGAGGGSESDGGGGGGAGIILENRGSLAIASGASVTAGTGGVGGDGGVGILLKSEGVVTIAGGAQVTGGGKTDFYMTAAAGGAAISAAAGSYIANAGILQGGAGGGAPGDEPPQLSGAIGGSGSGGAIGHTADLNRNGVGGNGILGAAGGYVTIVNSGRIAGGSGHGGRANAISLFGSGNRLELLAGSTIQGNVVVADGGSDNVLALSGDANSTFDVSQIAANRQYRGFDTLEKDGASTWTLTGTSTFTGSTVVNEGTLRAGGAGAFSTGAYVVNGGFLDLGGFNLTTSSLSGAGGEVVVGNSVLTVTQNADASYAGVFSGSGAFDLKGTGVFTLTGNSSAFTGTTTVADNSELIVGTLAEHALGGSIAIRAGGLLGGSGTVGSTGSTVSIEAGAAHAPGTFTGTQTVAGNYTNQGILRIEATPTGANRLIVEGAVDITGAGLELMLSPYDASAWNFFDTPLIIIEKQSEGAVAGSFGSVDKNLLFLDVILDYAGGDGNDVTMAFYRNDLTFAQVGQTRNQIATAAAIEPLGNTSQLWRSIASIGDPDIARASYDLLSGEVYASAKSAMIEDSRFLRNAINNRIHSAFGSVDTLDTPVLAYGDGGPQLASLASERLAVWGQAFGSRGHADSDGNAATLDLSTSGFFIGADALVFDSWRLGAVAGYSRTSFDVKDRASSGASDNFSVGLYGGSQWGNLTFSTGLAYTWHDIDARRAVPVPGVDDSVKGDYNAATTQVFGEFGYGVDAGHVAYEPFANLAYVNLHTDGFAESGGIAALSVESDTTETTFTTLGLRASTTFDLSGARLTARGMLGWRHAFGDITPLSTQAFAGSDTLTVAGVPIARDAAVIEAGAGIDFTDRATLSLLYAGQIGDGSEQHGFSAKLGVAF